MQQLFVIKIGGQIIDNTNLLEEFLKQLSVINEKVILIHGGGKLATELATTLQIPQKMIQGRRVTDAETLKLVTMVYAGNINKNIVAKLHAKGSDAIGFTGADGNLIRTKKRVVNDVDYGFVGDLVLNGVNTELFKLLLNNNFLPVIAPITHDGDGQLLNTNADTIANGIAKSLSQDFDVHLVYCFDKKGILQNINDEGSLITQVNKQNINTLKKERIINEGMIPKIDNAMHALENGVEKVSIGHALELQQIIDGNAGTTITL